MAARECFLPSPRGRVGYKHLLSELKKHKLSKPGPGGAHRWVVDGKIGPAITLQGLWVMFKLKSEQ